MDGEVSADLFAAVTNSPARILMLPPRSARLRWVGAPDWPLAQWVENAVIEVQAALDEHSVSPGSAVTGGAQAGAAQEHGS
jgi:hypothetical protein